MKPKQCRLIDIAVLFMILTFLYVFCVTYIEPSPTGKEHSKTILGFLFGTGIVTFLNYYWGASHKDEPPDPK